MSSNNENINLKDIDQKSKAFFSGGNFSWSKSQHDIWAEMETAMDSKSKGKSITFNFRSVGLAVAASILLLIGVGTFIRFYSVTIETPAAEHQLAILPDGSSVRLNAVSKIKYKPLWWRFNREIQFEGEGYFEVEKGQKFSVKSAQGTTEVLGTSFNIFSRDEVYKVTCLTGRVKVTSSSLKSVILKPNSKAEIQPDGEIEIQKNIDTVPEISWKQNLFMFTASPIREVFFEIERQYNVQISTQMDSYALYTGNFSKDLELEEVLGYVCPALGLEYFENASGVYVITEEPE